MPAAQRGRVGEMNSQARQGAGTETWPRLSRVMSVKDATAGLPHGVTAEVEGCA